MQTKQPKTEGVNKPKVVAIVGQTAVGKSDIGVLLARKFNAEIISCDSRQVYKGLNLGTGKITKKEMRGIPHHMLDISNASRKFTAFDFQKLGSKKIEEILKKNKNPMLVGGTGFYAQVLLEGWQMPNIKENKKLRDSLNKKSIEELIEILKKIDPVRQRSIDTKNKVRLVRSIEIAKAVGAVPKIKKTKPYDVLWIGLMLPDQLLKERITKRLNTRLKKGMVAEVVKLHKNGLSYKRMEDLGLEYRYISRFLNKKLSKDEMVSELDKEIWKYTKRQKTWFKKIEGIRWFTPDELEKIEKATKLFLKN